MPTTIAKAISAATSVVIFTSISTANIRGIPHDNAHGKPHGKPNDNMRIKTQICIDGKAHGKPHGKPHINVPGNVLGAAHGNTPRDGPQHTNLS